MQNRKFQNFTSEKKKINDGIMKKIKNLTRSYLRRTENDYIK